MTGAVDSMPILTASAPKSESTESICRATNSGGRLNTPCTPSEFCAVTAVRTDRPKTRKAVNVLRSAWMPAPPPESEPAMVSAFGTLITVGSIRGPPVSLKPARSLGRDHDGELAADRAGAEALALRAGGGADDLLELLGQLARDDDLAGAEDLDERLQRGQDAMRGLVEHDRRL